MHPDNLLSSGYRKLYTNNAKQKSNISVTIPTAEYVAVFRTEEQPRPVLVNILNESFFMKCYHSRSAKYAEIDPVFEIPLFTDFYVKSVPYILLQTAVISLENSEQLVNYASSTYEIIYDTIIEEMRMVLLIKKNAVQSIDVSVCRGQITVRLDDEKSVKVNPVNNIDLYYIDDSTTIKIMIGNNMVHESPGTDTANITGVTAASSNILKLPPSAASYVSTPTTSAQSGTNISGVISAPVGLPTLPHGTVSALRDTLEEDDYDLFPVSYDFGKKKKKSPKSSYFELYNRNTNNLTSDTSGYLADRNYTPGGNYLPGNFSTVYSPTGSATSNKFADVKTPDSIKTVSKTTIQNAPVVSDNLRADEKNTTETQLNASNKFGKEFFETKGITARQFAVIFQQAVSRKMTCGICVTGERGCGKSTQINDTFVNYFGAVYVFTIKQTDTKYITDMIDKIEKCDKYPVILVDNVEKLASITTTQCDADVVNQLRRLLYHKYKRGVCTVITANNIKSISSVGLNRFAMCNIEISSIQPLADFKSVVNAALMFYDIQSKHDFFNLLDMMKLDKVSKFPTMRQIYSFIKLFQRDTAITIAEHIDLIIAA